MAHFLVSAEKLLYGGDALAKRDDGKTVFVPYAVPGDRLLVRPTAEKKNYIRAEIIDILTPGEGRVSPACQHFGKCGGCHWQQIEYSRQVETKRLILEELFNHRFPGTEKLTITMQPCSRPFAYRSRARVRRCVINKPQSKICIGFFRGGSHFVEDIESCLLFRPRLNKVLHALRLIPAGAFEADSHIHEIDIAVSEEDEIWAISKGGGRDALLKRKAGDFNYNLAAGTFFQANDFMIDALVSRVMDCVSQYSGSALDLFSGVGLFSLPLTRRFRFVTAVEYSRASHRLCAMNAAGAGIENLETVCADAAGWLNLQTSRFDCVVLDPPRTGAGSGVMEQVGRLTSSAIVYVSCDPQTLARDLGRLDMNKWRIVSVAGFDMFPQTYHFETIVHLEANQHFAEGT
jgi:23S rRNA (uracil1939-C5)-methyltransferase